MIIPLLVERDLNEALEGDETVAHLHHKLIIRLFEADLLPAKHICAWFSLDDELAQFLRDHFRLLTNGLEQ